MRDWIDTIENEDDVEDIRSWARRVQKRRMTEDEFVEASTEPPLLDASFPQEGFSDRDKDESLSLHTIRMAISKSIMHFARVPSSHQFHQNFFQAQPKCTE